MPGARQVLITRSIDRHEFNTRAIEPQPRAGKGPYVLSESKKKLLVRRSQIESARTSVVERGI